LGDSQGDGSRLEHNIGGRLGLWCWLPYVIALPYSYFPRQILATFFFPPSLHCSRTLSLDVLENLTHPHVLPAAPYSTSKSSLRSWTIWDYPVAKWRSSCDPRSIGSKRVRVSQTRSRFSQRLQNLSQTSPALSRGNR
jgi:hypothetical protein